MPLCLGLIVIARRWAKRNACEQNTHRRGMGLGEVGRPLLELPLPKVSSGRWVKTLRPPSAPVGTVEPSCIFDFPSEIPEFSRLSLARYIELFQPEVAQ